MVNRSVFRDLLRPLARTGMGIKGMTLQGEDYIINISLVPKDSNDDLLVVTEKGTLKGQI